MREDILTAVVEVEKELAGILENEKIRAQEHLEKLRLAAEKEVAEEERRLQEALDTAITNAGTSAEKKALGMVDKAGSIASRLEGVSDNVLKGIIRRYIKRILP